MTTARPPLALALVGGLLLAADAAAQQRIDPSRMIPIRAPVRDAGTFDPTTGKWTRPNQGVRKNFGIQCIYRNNCTWAGGSYYAGFELCEDNYDEGRVPSTSSPSAPAGAVDVNQMDSFVVSYCTNAGNVSGAGGYDMDVAFYDKLLGDCVGFASPTPPHPSATASAYFALAGTGLPGSTSVGFQACWTVTVDVSNTGWTLASDGEGSFDNVDADDKFIWMQRQNTWASPLGYPSATPDGFIIMAEPDTSTGSGGYGSCTYSIACGVDAVFGNTCGTGLDTFDSSWINVDGIAAGDTSGSTPPGCPNAVSQYGFGTNCYFFGGYPGNPFASYWLELFSERRGVPCGQANSCGLIPALTSSISTFDISLSGAGTWDMFLGPVPAAPNPGMLIYSTSGFVTPISTTFGSLCISPFFRATSTVTVPASTAGGCATPSSYTFDFGSYIAANDGMNGIVWGNLLYMQAWHRDPANPGTANFSTTTGPLGPLSGGSPPPPPTVGTFSPTTGTEGATITINGSGFGGQTANVRVLVADGRGFADVTGFPAGQLTADVLPVGQAVTNGTGVGPLTVIVGFGTSLPNNVVVLGGITSTATQTQQILNGSGTNSAANFTLTAAPAFAVNVNSGTPLPGGMTLDMTGVTGNTLQVQLAFKVGGAFRTFEMRLDLTGSPGLDDLCEHVATQIAAQFGAQGVSTSFTATTVRVSMAGSTYGSFIVKGT